MSKIYISGGHGFLGRALFAHLTGGTQDHQVLLDDHYRVDFTEKDDVFRLLDCLQPDYIYHLAGYNGGIDMNVARPFDIFSKNTQMAVNLMECATIFKPKKMVCVVASCAYPCEFGDQLFEQSFLMGSPHETVAGHGYAKRNLQLACKFARKQHNLNAVCVCPTTLYGNHLTSEAPKMKVVDSLFHRLLTAKQKGDTEFTLWGTGRPMREVLYVDDAAKLLALAMERYDCSDKPLNLGTGQEYSIDVITKKICDVIGYHPIIKYDSTKPDGQFRKRLDLERMQATLGQVEFTPFEEGLSKTYDRFRNV